LPLHANFLSILILLLNRFGMSSPQCAKLPHIIHRNLSEDFILAPCLDNARKCFLVLKCVHLPLALVYGGVTLALHYLWHFGYVETFSSAGFLALLLHVIIVGIPTTVVPVITRLRRLPVPVRMATNNILFAAMCMLVPVISAHRVWRRQYHELNGLLLIHEFLPSAPPRARPAHVQPHEPLSICDDAMFFTLAMTDHASILMSNFMLWNFIELPPKYFAFSFSAHILHFWFSAHRVTAVYGEACTTSSPSINVFL
jgi:hypothetical protein